MSQPSTGRPKWKVFFLLFANILLVAIPPGFDYLIEALHKNCGQHQQEYSEIVKTYYRFLSTPGYRKPEAHNVRVVTIQENEDPLAVVLDGCKRRAYLTKLIPALVKERPAEIVLDFGPEPNSTCEAAIDAELQSVIKDAAQNVPVVVGIAALTLSHLPPALADTLKKQGFNETSLYQADPRWISKDLQDRHDPQARYGQIDLLCDTREVPLSWEVFQDRCGPDGKFVVARMDTISVAAAKIFRDSTDLHTLQRARTHRDPPRIGFLDIAQFKPVRAIDLVCPHRQNPETWINCSPGETRLTDLRATITVVGLSENHLDADIRQTVVGEVPGFVLQANYIEAILDDRLLWQLPIALRAVLGILLMIIINLIFFTEHSLVKALAASFALLLVCFLICRLATLEVGCYLDFWISGALVLPLTFIERLREQIKEAKQKLTTPSASLSPSPPTPPAPTTSSTTSTP